MQGGGAERVMGNLVNSLDRSLFTPLLVSRAKTPSAYPLAPDIASLSLPSPAGTDMALAASAALAALPLAGTKSLVKGEFRSCYQGTRNTIKEVLDGVIGLEKIVKEKTPAAMIVFLQTSITIALLHKLLFRRNIPIIGSDRIFLSSEIASRRYMRINKIVIKSLYRHLYRYIAISHQAKDDMISNFSLPPSIVHVIHNGIDLVRIRQLATHPLPPQPRLDPTRIRFIASGRLVPQKGFHDLLRAFASLQHERASQLLILGEGPLQNELHAMAEQLGIATDVIFLGWQQNPFAFLACADIFVLPSHYEGFPNALLEAMAVGLPVIATDCPSGPAELLDRGRYGMLVSPGDPCQLSAAMRTMAADSTLRQRLTNKSLARASSYTIDNMVRQYEQVLLDAIPPRRHKTA